MNTQRRLAACAIGVAMVHFWGEPFWIGAVAAIFGIGQFVEGNYLQPKIIGGHVGLHPVWLMFALAVFGTLFGFVGLIVAVPLAAMVGVIARFVAGRYKESGLYTGREVPPPPPQPTLIELVPRGTVAATRSRAEMAKSVAVAEARVEDARREAARVAEETVKASPAHVATVTAEVDADPRVADAHAEIVEVRTDAADPDVAASEDRSSANERATTASVPGARMVWIDVKSGRARNLPTVNATMMKPTDIAVVRTTSATLHDPLRTMLVTTDSTISPTMSSRTAAPKTTWPSRVPSCPRSERTRAEIPIDVAVSADAHTSAGMRSSPSTPEATA